MPSSSDPAGPHPSAERIAAYHERRLAPGEAEEMRAHLAACPGCTAELLAFAECFDEPEDSASGLSAAEMDAAWRRQRERPAPALPVRPAPAAPPPRRSTRGSRGLTVFLGLAASLFAALSLVQWQMISRLREPRANPPLVNLAPVGSLRRGTEDVSVLEVPPAARRGWVILDPVAEPNDAAYDAELVAPGGGRLLLLEDLRGSEKGNFRLDLPVSLLREGEHRILLRTRRGDGRAEVTEFKVRVHLSPPPVP